ncbi:N-acetylmannosamine-6-phosphate 2-epimerase [Paenibacillus albiflavus]|uniref:Putative N-acetylmannosamine-6-phosphate 2-epimerase n=1 Tax=Paenibacillus albiflavus TaxID=2545760 RepID=A0A4R4EF97_9BACL|nr:N-acetylmannosamine-6-phosphate 2-epimerase [Paenibacillus albiflavus]TCZ78736.1 N-acetylmannosamine-6-phosphate 2-epimerase [Paenibacillus albiflavus]
MNDSVINKINKGLIVSCQALEHEPLFGADIMAKMATAAEMGGAVCIRANSVIDIAAIKKVTSLPIIGLIKRDYEDSEIFITPTLREVKELMDVGVDIIALDCTRRKRPNNETLEEIVEYMKQHGQKIMADISTLEEAIYAESIGIDCVSTTLSGYTPYSPQQSGPDFQLLKDTVAKLNIPVIAEGKIFMPSEAIQMLNLGAYAVVVGSAITRPQLITERYVNDIRKALG